MEPLTPERRRQLTYEALVSAAEEVFARQGFEGASLEEIAATAGFSRGAIYSNFGGKEQLFLAVIQRFNEQSLAQFRGIVETSPDEGTPDLAAIAERWHAVKHRDAQQLALSLEFTLHLLRNSAARDSIAEQRQQIVEMVAGYIERGAASLGTTPRIPAATLARIVLATTDGLELAGHFEPNKDDLYKPFLELFLSAFTPSGNE